MSEVVVVQVEWNERHVVHTTAPKSYMTGRVHVHAWFWRAGEQAMGRLCSFTRLPHKKQTHANGLVWERLHFRGTGSAIAHLGAPCRDIIVVLVPKLGRGWVGGEGAKRGGWWRRRDDTVSERRQQHCTAIKQARQWCEAFILTQHGHLRAVDEDAHRHRDITIRDALDSGLWGFVGW